MTHQLTSQADAISQTTTHLLEIFFSPQTSRHTAQEGDQLAHTNSKLTSVLGSLQDQR